MSVVGLTFGDGGERDPAERRERGQRRDQRDDPRVGAHALVPGEPAGERDRQHAERAELPAHAIASAARARISSATLIRGSSAPPAPPRIRAVSVAK